MTRLAFLSRVLLPAGLTVLLTACVQTLQTSTTVQDYSISGPLLETCKSNIGGYYLPKKLLMVTVNSTGQGSSDYSIQIDTSKKYVNDRGRLFCLDFLFSPFAVDKIGVSRADSGLLQRVFTESDDKSVDIGKQIIRAAGNLAAASKAGGFGALNRNISKQVEDAGGKQVVAYFEYDPFSRHEAEAVNRALHPLGYCLFFESRRDPFVPDWSRESCDLDEVYKFAGGPPERSGNPQGQELADIPHGMDRKGLLYRPELSHVLRIMKRRGRHGRWRFAGSEHVVMPNRAPVFALGVKRALFVTAKTDVQFEDGILKDISIHKPSELKAFVDIPLYVAQVVLSIPAASVRIFENNVANREALIATNTKLIKTLRDYNADAQADAAVRNGSALIVRSADGTGRSVAVAPAGSPEVSPALRSLGECLEDSNIAQSENGATECVNIVKQGG